MPEVKLPADLPEFCLNAMRAQLATFGVEPACNFDGALAALRQRPDDAVVEAQCRPIIGIENRTPQEVFDIMCDRIRKLAGQ